MTAVNELWKERKSIHASGDAEAVDVIIGLFVVALHNFQPVSDLESKSVLNYIQDIILPILIDKEINVISSNLDSFIGNGCALQITNGNVTCGERKVPSFYILVLASAWQSTCLVSS